MLILLEMTWGTIGGFKVGHGMIGVSEVSMAAVKCKVCMAPGGQGQSGGSQGGLEGGIMELQCIYALDIICGRCPRYVLVR